MRLRLDRKDPDYTESGTTPVKTFVKVGKEVGVEP
jgi:hypothetical protein